MKFILLNLLLISSYWLFVFGQKDFYFITLPNFLMTETMHTLNIHTSNDLKLIIESIHIDSKIKIQSPVYVIRKGFQTISYNIPFIGNIGSKIKLNFLGDICTDIDECKLSNNVIGKFVNKTYELGLIDKNYILFAETDKPIYKPGETIKLRFMPIYPTNLMRKPNKEGKKWKIKLDNEGKYKLIEATNRTKAEVFEMVIIEDPNGVRMAQWDNVTLQNAMNLKYQLTKDPVLGLWKSKAIYKGQKEETKFSVKKYVLPLFVVDVSPPKEVLANDKKIKFNICAKYSTGKKMKAQIYGNLCLKVKNKKEICVGFKSSLNKKNFCSKISLKTKNIFKLVKNNFEYANSIFVVNVTVTENGTTSAVSKVIETDGIKFTPYIILFESKQYFKPGLPYFGRLRLTRHNKRPKINATVTISVDSGWDHQTKWGFKENYTSDNTGAIDFVIPYIPLEKSIQIRINGAEDLKQPMSTAYFFQSLSNWESVDKQYLQIQSVVDPIKCPGEVNLTILTNTDISSINMYVQLFYRGRVSEIKEFSPIPVKCESRDDFLGHYTCTDNELLSCLSGWKGDNCREPICESGCINGACIEPNICLCKNGWKGKSCEQCIIASFCKNGFCVYGNDCKCLPGWSGFDCSKKGPKKHYYDPKSKDNYLSTLQPEVRKEYEKQTIFERIITIPLKKSMGPDVHIIVYFINDGLEIVTDSIELSLGLKNCSHLGGGKFGFDKETAVPKSNVRLTIDPGTKENSCAVRISDVALSQFGKSSNADLSYLIRKLMELNHKITVDNPDRSNIGRLCISATRQKRRIMPYHGSGIDSRKALALAGFTAITNTRIINSKCRISFLARGGRPENDIYFRKSESPREKLLKKDSKKEQKKKLKNELKKQIRDYFPESWVFSYFDKTVKELNLTVPDSMTTWKADSYCMTEKGIWIAPTQKLKVIMPFFADIYVPYSIKLGEKLSLPVKLFNYADSCYEISAKININESEIYVVGLKSFTICVCKNDEKTIYFNISPKVIGKLNITVTAESKYSTFCENSSKKSDIGMYDAVRRQLFVEPQGVPSETTFSELICNKNEEFGIIELFNIPTKIVPGSLRSYLKFNGDVMGQTFDNLDQMVKMPYGCGEQNMVALVPSIYVLEYLSELKISNPDLTLKAKGYIVNGYARQLSYKHDDGSFSAFGKTDKAGSTWLTAFVLRSFSDASKYMKINKLILTEAVNYLSKMQSNTDGCFKENGKLLSNVMAGGLKNDGGTTDESLLSAFVLISLKSINLNQTTINVTEALRCVKSQLTTSPSNYRLALTAYVLSIYEPNSKLTKSVIQQLEKLAVSSERYKHWTFDKEYSEDQKTKAADVETTGYALLSLLNYQSISESLKIVYWLSNQRSSLGGYFSTQDTVVALNALAVFAQLVGVSDVINLNVSVNLNKKIDFTDHLTMDNRLVSRNIELGSQNISYISIKTSGSGCLSLQLISLYNVEKLYSAKDVFKLTVKSKVPSSKACNTREINICFAYLRLDKNSNMILLTVDYPSGWQLSDGESDSLKEKIVTPLNRIDFQNKRMELYYDAISYNDAGKDTCFNFQLKEKIKISNIQPALVRIVDYYAPELYTDASYSVTDKSCNETTNKPKEFPEPLSCPRCLNLTKPSIIEFLEKICSSRFSGLVLKDKKDTSIKERTFYQPLKSIYYEWTLDLKPENCSCLTTWIHLKSDFVILAARSRYLIDKLVLKNDSVMFPLEVVLPAYEFDLRNQCSVASNLYSMINRVKPKIFDKITTNNRCPACILDANLYFQVKNVTQWICRKHNSYNLTITSVNSTKIKGVLEKNNNSMSFVELIFPNQLCYCQQALMDMKRSFIINDDTNTIELINNEPNEPIQLFVDSKLEFVENSIYNRRHYFKCVDP